MKKYNVWLMIAGVLFFTAKAFAVENFNIIDQTDSPKAVEQARVDYQTIFRVYQALTKIGTPEKMTVVIYPEKHRFEAQAKGLPLTGLSEGYLQPDGSLLLQTNPKRGVIVHELLHAFAHSIKNEEVKEEFFCVATQFLLDGFTPETDLIVSGDIKAQIQNS